MARLTRKSLHISGTERFLPFLFGALLLVAGCEGPQGPQGEGLGTLDLEPPVIDLLHPSANDTVYADTFSIEVSVYDEHFDYVDIFIDGTNSLGDSTARIEEEPFIQVWTFAGSGLTTGMHILTAQAVDETKNDTWTPPIPIWYYPPTGLQVIQYHEVVAGDEVLMTLPDQFGDRYFNVRFTPLKACTVKEIRFVFDHFDNPGNILEGGWDFYAFLWSSLDGFPDEPIDSFLVEEDEILYDQVMAVDVSSGNHQFSSDFHAGFSPPSDEYDLIAANNRGLALVSRLVDPPGIDDSEHRSIEFETEGDDTGWGTILDDWASRRDFYISVLVDYGGEEAVLRGMPEMERSAAAIDYHRNTPRRMAPAKGGSADAR